MAQGYFMGVMFIWILPNVLSLHWPYSLIPGYASGLILSALITFFLFKKWHASRNKKVIVAVIWLSVLVIVSTVVVQWMAELLKIRAIEALG